jgi:2-isopropylmalate synthase
MTRRRGMTAAEDPGIQALLSAETAAVTVVGKSSEFQATTVLGVDRDENLAMIRDTVRLFRDAGREVIYDAEHFFDAYRADADYAIATLLSAQDAGAAVLCLCDTNGGSLPEFVGEAVAAVRRRASVKVGIHTHNDGALAVANALSAVRAGADHVQGTINGVGERCGNMDLIPLIANLSLKMNCDVLRPATMGKLTEVSRYVYEIANMNFVPGQPFVGSSAFAHKGGMHVHAVRKDPATYEHVDPSAVGNERRILVSELSGQSNIAVKAGGKFDIAQDRAALKRVLEQVQDLENAGYQFEAAEASFELLLRLEVGRYKRFFDLAHYRVEVERVNGDEPVAEATLKIRLGDAVEHTVAEGNGPVDALNGALRRALQPHHESINQVHLIDYKVRVINARAETAAAVRVVIEWRRDLPDGGRELIGTIGVSSNIIEASWQAIVDAYEYHLVHVEEAVTIAVTESRR